MDYETQHAATGRVILPDLVRAFALIGIALVNVAYIAYPGDNTYHAGGLETLPDQVSYFAVNALFLLKSYTLFSFMFGVGLAYQMSSAKRHGASSRASYCRRMIAFITAALSILFASLWRQRFSRGPMEHLLHYWSYLGKR